MRPPEEVKRELVQQWLAKAEEDFNVANFLLSQGQPYLSTIGFHSQQCAEKYLKAYLARHQVEFPKTHHLGALLDLISKINSSLADSLKEITALNPYSVTVRYPAGFPEMSLADAQNAVDLASKVREAILPALKESA